MVRGFCPRCEQLVPIIAGRWRVDYKQRVWWTAEHPDDKTGKPCEGGKI